MAHEEDQTSRQSLAEEPSPDPFEGLGGFDVKSFIAGDESAQPPEPQATPPTHGYSQEELNSLRDEVAKLQENAKQQHANWNAEHMARKNAEEFVAAMRQVRLEEQAQAQAMAAQQPPAIEVDWASAYEDPEKLGEAVKRLALGYAEWGRNQALGYAYPHLQQLQAVSSVLGPLQSAAIESMMDRAEQKLRNEHGVEDFAEYRDRIRDEFLRGGPEGVKLMAEPEHIARVYTWLAVEDGKPINQAERSKEPIHAGGGPSFRRQTADQSRSELPPELRNIWNEMAPAFRLSDGSRVNAPTPEELDSEGIEWSGSHRRQS